jgi:hypothetical protein
MTQQNGGPIGRTRCFQVNAADNVATALDDLFPGAVEVLGVAAGRTVMAIEPVALGHKIALRGLAADEPIVKFGVPIGVATGPIAEGGWVHLHNCRSRVDERSSHLDVKTGAALDTLYA